MELASNQDSARESFGPREMAACSASILIASYVALLAQGYVTGEWLADAQGRYLGLDFISFYTASVQLRDGAADVAYDWTRFEALERSLFGDLSGTYGWHYAPTLLVAIAPLAFLPYPAAFLVWNFSTLAAYGAAIAATVRRRLAWLCAIAFPAAFLNFSVGQSGAATAALVAGALASAERRPALAGMFLGLLTYKPQFGILFPFVLVAGGHWRMIASAAVTTMALVAVTSAVLGASAWTAFFANARVISEAVLADGRVGPGKLQTLFGLMRDAGFDLQTCFVVQALGTVTVIVLLMALWRRSTIPYTLKAAALACSVLFATPYAYIYDHTVLAVGLAFLVRHGLETRLDPLDLCGIAAVVILILLFPFVRAPVGLAAQFVAVGLVARRIFLSRGDKVPARWDTSTLALAKPDRLS
jgi:arabinofuranan 3-O-arabinosyltransferase